MSIIKLSNNGVKNATAFGSITTSGAMTFIKKLTASSSSTLSFVDGSSDVVLDNTYKEYLFTFNNIHPSASQGEFQVNFRDGGSDYDATKTTTFFHAYADEADTTSDATVSYNTGKDIAQGTGFQIIADDMSNDNDGCGCGTLHLFNPSSTTFVKHFISRTTSMHGQPASFSTFVAGYCNTTTAIDGVQFKFSSGNIDAGTIKLYGLKDS